MKCPRCSNELSNSSTFCSQCGFNLQQNLNYTAPENYAGASREQPMTFSYLPAGTPPWPTTVPQNIPGVVAPAPQSRPMPPPKAAAESKPRRTVGGILSVIAVVILAPLIGILITTAITGTGRSTTQASQTSSTSKTNNTSQQAAATPAGSASNQNPVLPTPTSFKTAKDTNVNISLQYPADWTQSSPRQSTNATSFNVSQDQIGINFFVTHFNDSISSSINNADELNQSNIQELTQVLNASNVRNVQVANQQPSIAGAKWIEKDATFTDTANNKMRFSTISVQHGKSYYVIYFFIPDGIYTEAMQKYIMPMLNSVKFLS